MRIAFMLSVAVATLWMTSVVRADDAMAMEGKWELMSMEFRGEKAPPDKVAGNTATIEGGKLTMPGGSSNVTLKLDATKDPKQVDFDEKGSVTIGIYKFEGDQLFFCLDTEGKNRPTKFESPAGSAVFMMVLKKMP